MSKVSVIMATKNGEQYMERAMESLIAQTIEDIQIIVVDDGSTDNTAKILEQYKSKYHITVLSNSKSMGLAYSLNLALQYADGEYVARMDDDDISLSERLEREVSFLQKNTEYDFVGSGAEMFDENGVFGQWQPQKEISLKDLFKGNVYIHPTVVFRTAVLKSVGGYSTDFKMNRIEDWNLWMNLYYKNFKGVNIQEVLFKYRETSDSFKKRDFKRRINQFNMLRFWRRRMNLKGIYYFLPTIPLIKGIVPQRLIQIYHKIKY